MQIIEYAEIAELRNDTSWSKSCANHSSENYMIEQLVDCYSHNFKFMIHACMITFFVALKDCFIVTYVRKRLFLYCTKVIMVKLRTTVIIFLEIFITE